MCRVQRLRNSTVAVLCSSISRFPLWSGLGSGRRFGPSYIGVAEGVAAVGPNNEVLNAENIRLGTVSDVDSLADRFGSSSTVT